MRKFLFLLVSITLVLFLAACGEDEPKEKEVNKAETNTNNQEESNKNKEEVEVKEVDNDIEEEEEEYSERDQFIFEVLDLIENGLAYDTGEYSKGEVKKGEYAFVKLQDGGEYYSEVDLAGNIIDNENFSSFGYVQVHEAGDITTDGVLISLEGLEILGMSGAKEVFEIIFETEDYYDSGIYKVGSDIKPGEYLIVGYGKGYVSVNTGPIGNSDIVENEHFDDSYKVKVKEGQYLEVSRGTIIIE